MSFADFLQQRDGPRADEVRLDLRGIALGNAWIDPYHQYDVSRYAHARGLITEGQVHSLRHAERACQRKLDAKQWYSKQCWDLLDTVIDDSGQKGRARVSMYDSRNFPKSASDFPPGHLDIERYMSTKAVRDALHCLGNELCVFAFTLTNDGWRCSVASSAQEMPAQHQQISTT